LWRGSRRKAAPDLGEEPAAEGVLCLCREACGSLEEGSGGSGRRGQEDGGAMRECRAYVEVLCPCVWLGVDHYWAVGGLRMKLLGLVGWEWSFWVLWDGIDPYNSTKFVLSLQNLCF
jgi:hypothetical protein